MLQGGAAAPRREREGFFSEERKLKPRATPQDLAEGRRGREDAKKRTGDREP